MFENIDIKTFSPDFEEWIDENIKLKNCKVQLFKTLLEKGYQYDLIKNRLNIDYNRISLRTAELINYKNLKIYSIKNFLTTEECDEIIEKIQNEPEETSTTMMDEGSDITKSNYRTSTTISNLNISNIEDKICKTLGISNNYGEKIQVQIYTAGQEFKHHTDYINNSSESQRIWTFMVYLNDVEEGGYTVFPRVHCSIKPKKGNAIIWSSVNDSYGINENSYSLHSGLPVIKGKKYIITKWFRNNLMNDIENCPIIDNYFYPIFNRKGFEKINFNSNSFFRDISGVIKNIKSWMYENEHLFVKETEISEIIQNTTKILNFDNAPDKLKATLINEIKKILSKWIGYKANLVHTSTYGIRQYLKGSSLEKHYDVKDTHIISAIIHLENDPLYDWPLYIEDHLFNKHNICMNYGDIILYESNTCLHGRPTKYLGNNHKNLYIHFKLEEI